MVLGGRSFKGVMDLLFVFSEEGRFSELFTAQLAEGWTNSLATVVLSSYVDLKVNGGKVGVVRILGKACGGY